MSEPIINPIFFYIADALSGLRILFFISGAFMFIFLFAAWFTYNLPENKKIIILFGSALIFVGVLIPSKKTCYKMAIAKYITPNNIDAITEYIDDVTTSLNDSTKDTIKELMDYTSDFIYNVRNNEKVSEEDE